jgi:hypothetical protein
MENVATANLHTGALVVALGVANRTIVVSVFSHRQSLVLFNTLRVKTWEALLFVLETTTGVTAREHFIAIFTH